MKPFFTLRASNEDPIPVFLSRCIQFIESEGVAIEGLYRVPGNRYEYRSLDARKSFILFSGHMWISFSRSLTRIQDSASSLWTLQSMLWLLRSRTSSSSVCLLFYLRWLSSNQINDVTISYSRST